MLSLRDIGSDYWTLERGPQNSICDVPGVRVGHATVIHDQPSVARTGVSVILPDAHFPEERLPAAGFVFNGTGELTGLHQINEWGYMETPIALTGTSGVAAALSGLLSHLIRTSTALGRRQAPPLPVVGECNDMFLNDSRAPALRAEHVLEAIAAARADQDTWGAVGGGTGMLSFGFKGGIGSASRRVDIENETFTLGVVCLVNFGPAGSLILCGHPLGHLPGEVRWRPIPADMQPTVPDGSLVTILATDAPLDHLGLRRLATRGPLGMARVGSFGRHGSGDLFLAFSTANRWAALQDDAFQTLRTLRQDSINPLFQAVVESTEEAILCALLGAHDMDGVAGHHVSAIPHDAVSARLGAPLKKY